MNQEPSEESAVLLPPRPNRGPDSWSPPIEAVWPAIALVVALVGVLGLVSLRRARRLSPQGIAVHADPPRVVNPPENLIAAAEAIRNAIAEAYGEPWLAKTTEELAGDATLREGLGAELAARGVGVLSAADRAKFHARAESKDETDFSTTWNQVRKVLGLRGHAVTNDGGREPVNAHRPA
jgi:hypothetical protein